MAEKRHYQLISPGGQVAYFEGHGLAKIKENVAEHFGVAPEQVESTRLHPEAFSAALRIAKEKTQLTETTVKGLGKRWTEDATQVDIVAGKAGDYSSLRSEFSSLPSGVEESERSADYNSGSLPPFTHLYD